jgi:gas vesicle protein
MKNIKTLITAAALGTIIGSLSATIYPQRKKILHSLIEQAEQARECADILMSKGEKLIPRKTVYRNNYLPGGVAGVIIGAGLALLLAPKSGKQLRTQVSKAYSDLSNKTHEAMDLIKNHTTPHTNRLPSNLKNRKKAVNKALHKGIHK